MQQSCTLIVGGACQEHDAVVELVAEEVGLVAQVFHVGCGNLLGHNLQALDALDGVFGAGGGFLHLGELHVVDGLLQGFDLCFEIGDAAADGVVGVDLGLLADLGDEGILAPLCVRRLRCR